MVWEDVGRYMCTFLMCIVYFQTGNINVKNLVVMQYSGLVGLCINQFFRAVL